MTDVPGGEAAIPPPRRRRRWGRIAVAVLLGLVLVVVAGGWFAQHRLLSQVEQLPDALPTTTDRPTREDTDAQNILLMGSDKRADGSIAGQRSDTMMLVNVSEDRKSVSVTSIPRDSWVEVPGHGKAKINAAFSWGGPALAVQTIENLTDVRIDHVAVIDWEGFKELTDALGGVTIKIPQDTYDAYRKKTWKAGTHRMDGDEALTYVRQRAGLPGGDFDRVKRQQNFMRSLLSQTLSTGTFANPVKLYQSLDAVTSNLTVDGDWSAADIRDLALSLRSVRSNDVRFTTVPVTGTGMEGAQSVVYIDTETAAGLWKAYRDDDAAAWIDDHKVNLPETVR